MNKYFIIIIIFVVSGAILSIPLFADQFANAKTLKKIQFTQTVTSSQDPSQGHGGEQLAMILPPSNGTLYHGSMTYAANEPVQIVILHEIDKSEAKGQPIWTVDGNTFFAETLVDPGTNAGSYDFTGAAVALHSPNSTAFTATISVDGWIRGQSPLTQYTETSVIEPSAKLSSTNVPAKIPLHQGFFDSNPVYYIITDSNDKQTAYSISQNQKWKVELAPALSNIPNQALAYVYIFTNGINGNGTDGFQNNVFSNSAAQKDYSPIRTIINVSWNIGRTPEILDSMKKILDANMTGKVRLTSSSAIMNMPQIIWPDGKMSIRENNTITDQTSYTGGQILNVDTGKMTVTFVAHRGWGPDGKTIYHIITDASSQGPANMMGVTYASSLVTYSSGTIGLLNFVNGLKGSGPFGFQEGISEAVPGNSAYSPLSKISLVTWNDPTQAMILENMVDIGTMKSAGKITIVTARVLDSDYVIDSPVVNPFQ